MIQFLHIQDFNKRNHVVLHPTDKIISFQAPSQYASVASFHSSKPAVPETERIQEPKPQAARPVALSPYAFGYQAEGSARQESADASGKVTGSYQVVNEDGSVRLVKYVADENGFRADIDTNEPGTKSDNPADVTLKSAAVEKKYEAPAKKYGAAHDFAQKATMYQQVRYVSIFRNTLAR